MNNNYVNKPICRCNNILVKNNYMKFYNLRRISSLLINHIVKNNQKSKKIVLLKSHPKILKLKKKKKTQKNLKANKKIAIMYLTTMIKR